MTGRMKLYHNPQSRAVVARWMLEEVGANYELVPVALREDGTRDPAILAVNPMGKIPTLVLEDETVVTESPAILAYLADRYPEAGMAPAVGTSERGSYYRWLFFVGSAFEPALIEKMMRRDAPQLPKMAPGWGSFDDVVDTIEGALEDRAHLVGDRFTAADLYMASGLWWGGMFGAPRLKESTAIQTFVGRAADRPAFKRAMAG